MKVFLFALLAICISAATTAYAEENLPEVSAAQLKEFQARFGHVKTWRVMYRYSGDNPHTWRDFSVVHSRVQWSESSEANGLVETTSHGDTSLQAFGEIRTRDSMSYNKVTSAPGSSETRYDRANGTASARVELELFFDNGTYRFGVYPNDLPSVYGGNRHSSGEIETYGPLNGTTHVRLPIPASDGHELRLPLHSNTLTGTYSHEDTMAALKVTTNGFDASEYAQENPAHGILQWSITPAAYEDSRSVPADTKKPGPNPLLPIYVPPADEAPARDIDLLVEAEDYTHWLPRGGASESVAGNRLAIKAQLVMRDGGQLTHRATSITFSLTQVSHEPGVALNFPLAGATSAADLGFEAEQNPDAQIGAAGGSATFMRGPYVAVTASLSSFDWGAYGSVLVHAVLDDGRVLVGHVAGGEGNALLVPKRSGGSRIGEAWKAASDFNGDDADDEDGPEAKKYPGDGLTAYEEYRGLILHGASTRETNTLNPREKNLLVINDLGEAGRAAMLRFTQANGIHVVEVVSADLPPDRTVNFYRGSVFGGAQQARLVSTLAPVEKTNASDHSAVTAVRDW